MNAAVPAIYVGLWRRERLLRPEGGRDVTTEVYWLQSNSLFVDLRIPQPRPDFRGYASPEELPAELIAWLPRQEGFAGTLTVQDDICHWHREIDYHPPRALEDIGRASFINESLMLESGVLADYSEVWRKSGPHGVAMLTMRAEPEPGGRAGILVVVGDCFMYAVDRTDVYPQGNEVPPWLQATVDCEIGFGRIRPGMPWRIERCSLPFREGRNLLAGIDAPLAPGDLWTPPETCVLRRAGTRWRVLESVPSPALHVGNGD